MPKRLKNIDTDLTSMDTALQGIHSGNAGLRQSIQGAKDSAMQLIKDARERHRQRFEEAITNDPVLTALDEDPIRTLEKYNTDRAVKPKP